MERTFPMSANIQGIQTDLRAAKLDGWLFYDFRGRDPIAQHILSLPEGMRTRRWYYFVPAKGTPKKLVHKIESETRRTPQKSQEAAGTREESSHAILPEK
jgi:hypothetical protein